MKFHIGTILSITNGRLLAKNHMDDIYAILNFMTNEDLFTHSLIQASKDCKPYLLEMNPILNDASDFVNSYFDNLDGKFDDEKFQTLLTQLENNFGYEFEVMPIHNEDRTKFDSIEDELKFLGFKGEIIKFEIPNEEPPISDIGDINW